MSILSTELQALSDWWHGYIDHLFRHPQATEVAHPAIAAVAQAAQPAPAPATKTLDPGLAKILNLPPGTQVLDTPTPAPAPATKPPKPAAGKSLNFSPSDQGWKNGAVDSKEPVTVTIDAELTANGFVMSMTRVWEDATLSVAGPGTLSGNSNDYGYVVPPTVGPVTFSVSGDREAVYGFAYRSGQ